MSTSLFTVKTTSSKLTSQFRASMAQCLTQTKEEKCKVELGSKETVDEAYEPMMYLHQTTC